MPETAPPANVPSAPTAVKLASQNGNGGTIQWTAPASGAAVAFYVIEKIPYHKAIWHGFVLTAAVLHFTAIAFEFVR